MYAYSFCFNYTLSLNCLQINWVSEKIKVFFPVKTKLKFWVKTTKVSHFKNVDEFDVGRSVVKELGNRRSSEAFFT